MKKLINAPEHFVQETLQGIVAAYPDRLRLLDQNDRVLLSTETGRDGKVGIVTGGGSGHLPVFLGYVGHGMADGCTVGNVFASPSYQAMADTIRACNFGAGVLCLYGNYGGDKMNFDQACEDAEFDGISVASVRVCDDIASAPRGQESKRRGVAGLVYAYKLTGAAAARRMSLSEVERVAQKVISNLRTIGVALSPCIVPEVGKPTFTIGEDEMEIGMGIHGEPGIVVSRLLTADETAQMALDRLLEDLPLTAGDEVSVMVNSLGATPPEELYILYRAVAKILRNRGISIFMPHIGAYATSMEMAGVSITLCKLDAELKMLLRDPADTPFYTNHNK